MGQPAATTPGGALCQSGSSRAFGCAEYPSPSVSTARSLASDSNGPSPYDPKDTPVLEWNIALELEPLRLVLRRAFAAAAGLGVRGVELCARGELAPGEISRTGLRHLRKLLEDHSLRVVAVRCPVSGGFAVLDQLDRRIAAVKSAMDLAGGLGAAALVASIGPIPPEGDAAARSVLLDALDDLGRHGHRAGAMLAADASGQSGSETASLLSAIPDGLLGIDLDPGRLLVHGHAPQEAVEALGRSILTVHVTDARRRSSAGLPELTPTGGGDADYPALAASLDQRDYRGPFIVRPGATHDPVGEAAAAIRYLRGLL
jgi:L-ribulose-5-phosphate 3-epimerase